MQTTEHTPSLNLWKRIPQFVEDNPQFNIGQINWLIRNRKSNGFGKAFKRIGRGMYTHEGFFAECIANKEDD